MCRSNMTEVALTIARLLRTEEVSRLVWKVGHINNKINNFPQTRREGFREGDCVLFVINISGSSAHTALMSNGINIPNPDVNDLSRICSEIRKQGRNIPLEWITECS